MVDVVLGYRGFCALACGLALTLGDCACAHGANRQAASAQIQSVRRASGGNVASWDMGDYLNLSGTASSRSFAR